MFMFVQLWLQLRAPQVISYLLPINHISIKTNSSPCPQLTQFMPYTIPITIHIHCTTYTALCWVIGQWQGRNKKGPGDSQHVIATLIWNIVNTVLCQDHFVVAGDYTAISHWVTRGDIQYLVPTSLQIVECRCSENHIQMMNTILS